MKITTWFTFGYYSLCAVQVVLIAFTVRVNEFMFVNDSYQFRHC